MIASFFKKSTPLNYALVVFLMLLFFCIYQFQDPSWNKSSVLMVQKAGVFILLAASAFLTSFIAKKNGLTKDSTYTAFFYFLLLLIFPEIFNNLNLVFANFFILLAINRVISLQSKKSAKEKIFDASLWVFVATLFHFWCVAFLILVFATIIFHVANDYRNWLLPFVSFFVVGTLFLFYALFNGMNFVAYYYQSIPVNFQLDYFANNSQNAAFSVYVSIALFFVFSIMTTLSERPSSSHISYKKIVIAFFIGALIFAISAKKTNDLLLLTISPLAILASAYMENPKPNLKINIVFAAFILCSLVLFFVQL